MVKGHLSIHIQSIIGTPVTGRCFTLEIYDIWGSRFLDKGGYIPHYVEWTGTETLLNYNGVDIGTEMELMVYEDDETRRPVGALWLRPVDILHSSNVAVHHDDGSSTVDTWFRLAPEGKIRLKLIFSELVPGKSLLIFYSNFMISAAVSIPSR